MRRGERQRITEVRPTPSHDNLQNPFQIRGTGPGPMQSTDVEHEIRCFVIDNFLYGRPLNLQPGDSLLEKGIIDSTGVLELVTFLETQYSFKVEDDEMVPDNLDSLQSLTAFVTQKLNGSA
jgi:acyl carrier protein